MAEAPRSKAGFAGVNGTRIYYEVAGTGHPLVLVHAGIADLRMWDGQVRVFAEHYSVVRYDMRGFGRSSMVAGPFSHRRDLYDLLRVLGIERACLVGCSKGGQTIIDLALEHPEMVDALVLVGSGLGGYEFAGAPPRQWDEMSAAYRRGDLARAAELELQIWVDGPQRTPDQVDPAVRDRVREMDLVALATPADLGIEQALEPAAVHRLEEIHAPTLVVVGDLDDPNIVAIADRSTAGITGARKVVMSGTAHVPNMERPAEFNRLVLRFLSDLLDR